MLIVAGNVTSSTGTSTVHVESLMHGLQNLWVASHSEVVVGAPNSDSLIHLRHVRARELLRESINVVEVPVGLVLVLLLQLGIVEAFIVEYSTFMLCTCRGVGLDGVDGTGVGTCVEISTRLQRVLRMLTPHPSHGPRNPPQPWPHELCSCEG